MTVIIIGGAVYKLVDGKWIPQNDDPVMVATISEGAGNDSDSTYYRQH